MPAQSFASRVGRRTVYAGAALLLLLAVYVALTVLISPVDVLNSAAPLRGVSRERDIPYGEDPRQRLDLYLPQSLDGAPLVVFVYGGSWQRGDKQTYKFVAAALARRGMIVVVPDYTLYPQGRFPVFVQDVARAVAWAVAWNRRDAAGRGARDRRIVMMGHSAGAHIAAMLTLDAQWLAPHGLDPRRDISAFVGLAGPYDFLPIKDPDIKVIFDVPDLARTQPITFVKGGEPPAFLGVSPSDTVVRPGNSERLAARITALGGRATVRRYAWTNHLTLLGSISPYLRFLAPTLDDVSEFIADLRPVGRP